jgi:hypothetical protein
MVILLERHQIELKATTCLPKKDHNLLTVILLDGHPTEVKVMIP